MQVNSSVNTRYYTQYYNSVSVKKGAGILKTEGDNYFSNETVGNQRSTETVDYQEFYKAWMSKGAEAVRGYAGSEDSTVSTNSTDKMGITDGGTLDSHQQPEVYGGPNAPEEVRQAFMEAAEESRYNEGERMDYLSQVFIHQVENRQNGVANYTDVFGSTVASALQAAREILYDLENPLMPVSQRGEMPLNT